MCSEWHNFQVFARWFDDNHVKGFELDKDIIIEGNKIYSPKTCCFVSRNENQEKAHAKFYNFIDGEGNKIKIYNLKKWCKENKKEHSGFADLVRSRCSSYKGYTLSKEGNND